MALEWAEWQAHDLIPSPSPSRRCRRLHSGRPSRTSPRRLTMNLAAHAPHGEQVAWVGLGEGLRKYELLVASGVQVRACLAAAWLTIDHGSKLHAFIDYR
jgi:hypothetical protein